jgi:glycosyltransferase involved in cell wall biosynthesis
MKDSITILFISHYASMYGSNRSLLQLIISLKSKYHIHPLILLREKGEICNFLEEFKIPYIISHYYWWVFETNKPYNRLHEILKQARNYFRVKQILNKLSGLKIDLVYSNSITVNIGALIGRKLGCKHIWHIRENMKQFSFKFTIGDKIAKRYFSWYTDKVITISDFITDSYKNIISQNKLTRIYNGIEAPIQLRKSNVPSDLINICIIGVISENKNQLDAVKTINLLVNKYKVNNIQLHIIGTSKKDYQQQVKAYIQENNLEEYIRIKGHQENIYSILSQMNIGLMCSRDEAFGRVTIEYMLNRMPVIASNSGANPELIQPGQNGELYEIYHPEDLAEKIYQFVFNTEKIEQYGAYAQRYAIENFSSGKNTDSIYKVIEEVFSK